MNNFEETIIKILLNHPEGLSPAYLLSVFSKAYRLKDDVTYREILRRKIYSVLRRLEKHQIIIKHQYNKRCVFYKLNSAKHVINLIVKRPISKIQTQKPDLLSILQSIDPEKVTGRLKVLKILSETRPPLDEQTKEIIYSEFLSYVENTNEKKLLFVRDLTDYDHLTEDDILLLPYLHRFNNPDYWKRYNREVAEIFRETAKRYKWAIHLTLTIDPKQFDNIIELFYEARRQINSLLTNLRKQHKKTHQKKLEYVRFNEFTQNGLLHFHIILFGRRYIKPVEQIARSMWKLGFVYAYQLVNSKGNWVYPRKKPKDYYQKLESRRRTLFDGGTRDRKFMQKSAKAYFYFAYPSLSEKNKAKEEEDEEQQLITADDLKKLDNYYLLNMALLWAFNLRTKTESRDLILKKKKEREHKEWVFLRAGYNFEIEEYLLNLNISHVKVYYIVYSSRNALKSLRDSITPIYEDPPPATDVGSGWL
jgi:Fe2+ or Zn2+ uptake regulation protein